MLLINLDELEDFIDPGQSASHDRVKRALNWLIRNNVHYKRFLDVDELLRKQSEMNSRAFPEATPEELTKLLGKERVGLLIPDNPNELNKNILLAGFK